LVQVQSRGNCPEALLTLDGMHWLNGCLSVRVVGGYFPVTLEGGRMGDNLEFFGEVLDLFLVLCLFYYDIGHFHA